MDLGAEHWKCPLGSPYAAFDPGHRYFPPNHPLFPSSDTRPSGCYETPQQAQAAGYGEALPPLGTEVVDGVYLVDTHAAGYGDDLDTECANAGLSLGFRVACPLRLPNAPAGGQPPGCGPGVGGTGDRPPCAFSHAFLFTYGGFAIPPGFHVLNPENPAHIVMSTHLAEDPNLDPDARYAIECVGAIPSGSVDLVLWYFRDTRTAQFLACRNGLPPFDRHIVLRWTIRGVVYQVAVEGFTQTSRDLAIAMAETVEFVGPPGWVEQASG